MNTAVPRIGARGRIAAVATALAAVALSGAPDAAAQGGALVVSPSRGEVAHSHRVAIRVRSSHYSGALAAKLNGVNIGPRFGPPAGGIRTLRASISDGLRRGRNVLEVVVRRRHLPVRRATVRFFVRRKAPLVGAGVDRDVIAGNPARAYGQVRNGVPAKLRWRVIREPGAPAAAGAVTGRATARLRLPSPRGRTTAFRPPAPGRYVLELAHGAGNRAVRDRVVFDALPPSPLVPIDTGEGRQGIQVGEQHYPIGLGDAQVLVLDRKTLRLVSNKDYDSSAGDQAARDLQGLDETKLVIATVQADNDADAGRFIRALTRIGMPLREPNPLNRFTAIGVPGLSGSADYIHPQTGSQRMQGYLTRDQYLNYGFVSTRRAEFALGPSASLPCGQGGCGGDPGYVVNTLNAYTLEPIAPPFVYRTGGRDSETAALEMVNALRDFDRDELFQVQAVSTVDPATNTYRPPVAGVAKETMASLAQVIASIGGTRNAFNRAATVHGTAASNGHVYQLLGWRGADEGEGIEAAAGVNGAGDLPAISGVLRPGLDSRLRPAEAAGTAESVPLAELAMREPTTVWPLDDNPPAKRAFSWIGKQLPTLGPDPRGTYWTSVTLDLDFDELADRVDQIGYPAGNNDFTEAEFLLARSQLSKELRWVANVRRYISNLSKPFSDSAITGWATVQQIGNNVYKAANPPEAKVGVDWLELTESILGLIPLFGPEGQAAAHLAENVAGITEFSVKAWGAASPEGEPPGREVIVEATDLAAELMHEAQQAEAAFSGLEAAIVSDPGKLQEIGIWGGCNPTDPECANDHADWAFTAADKATASANLYLGIERTAYQKLLPLGFPIFALTRVGGFHQGIVHTNPPDPTNYKCYNYHPWADYPHLSMSSTSLLSELDPVHGDNGWDTFVISRTPGRTDQHGTPPSDSIMSRVFGAISKDGNPTVLGLGLSMYDFAFPEARLAPIDRIYWEGSESAEGANCGWTE